MAENTFNESDFELELKEIKKQQEKYKYYSSTEIVNRNIGDFSLDALGKI